jgi:hypothetical protein
MFGWPKRRNKVKTADFSIEIRAIFRERLDVVYQENNRKL